MKEKIEELWLEYRSHTNSEDAWQFKEWLIKQQEQDKDKYSEDNMKNILGTEENLELFNENGIIVYEYFKYLDGYSLEFTYDSNSNVLTYKDSDGHSEECTYDSQGNELTYKDSDGVSRGFDIPEYTMEELVSKLGNFKIKK